MKLISKVIMSLRSYSVPSYASITNDQGSYLQVAGGGVTCLLELYRADIKKRFRAFSESSLECFPDGTLLVFGGGKIPMKSDEWISAQKVVDAFVCFSKGQDLPVEIHWRPAPGF
ncbi:hypothetical protein SLW56_16360 [Xanthomonas sp. LF07-6]|uniref:hypothetical protein n=1 Tax=Xanthomonas sp. LF07-6 TaxID=3097550 RepID=UPI002A811226|nr:hypothetical protein [Xanthomonas sp. LF07-6]MDY4341360.1 hypothetical protein [Xanthomonas sp. LF07-6]